MESDLRHKTPSEEDITLNVMYNAKITLQIISQTSNRRCPALTNTGATVFHWQKVDPVTTVHSELCGLTRLTRDYFC